MGICYEKLKSKYPNSIKTLRFIGNPGFKHDHIYGLNYDGNSSILSYLGQEKGEKAIDGIFEGKRIDALLVELKDRPLKMLKIKENRADIAKKFSDTLKKLSKNHSYIPKNSNYLVFSNAKNSWETGNVILEQMLQSSLNSYLEEMGLKLEITVMSERRFLEKIK